MIQGFPPLRKVISTVTIPQNLMLLKLKTLNIIHYNKVKPLIYLFPNRNGKNI